MYATSIGIPDNIKCSSIALLNARLADVIDLALKLKYAHWNIHGPHFIVLHSLTMNCALKWTLKLICWPSG